MRKFITIMESISDDSLVDHIAGMVQQGYHEGFSPYWKLNADPRLLEDGAAMLHISELIAAGFTSGHHPTWDLTVIEGVDGGEPDNVNAIPDAGNPHSRFDYPDGAPLDAPIGPGHARRGAVVDEEIVDEGKKHKVVAVHQKMGHGAGWWECHDDDAERFVVEDEHGEPIESYDDRNSAEAHCHHLNTGEQMLDEIDIDPTDNGDIPHDHPDVVIGRGIQDYLDAEHLAKDNPHTLDLAPTSFSGDPDHVVEVAAIHERGHLQDEAFEELRNRGIELTPGQMAQAGR